MKIFRNPEIKNFTLIFSLLSLVFCSVSYFISPVFSLAALIFSLFSYAVFIIFTISRYKRIQTLTDDIDKILNGKEVLKIKSFKEGELSILENEVEKMFIRLAEQKDKLIKEKRFLADSIADLSHQLRTPLTSIMLLLSLLSDTDISDERREELLRELSSLIVRTEKLVNTLLKISKLDAGTIEFQKNPIDVSSLINKAAEPLMIPMDIKNITFSKSTEGVSFTGDMLWFTEAISNIIKNSVEHTPDGGEITVTAENNPIFTEIIIKDSGKGFYEEDIPHIFDRFYKGKNSSNDSFGIGLNLAKTIIHSQNGTIKADNSPLGGARFTIKIYNR